MSSREFAYSARRTLNNAIVFGVGKVFSALATLFWLGLVVRLLGVNEYGHYLAAIAALETSIVIGAVGLDWIVVRYVPELYVKQAFRGLRRFLVQAVLARLAVSAALAVLLFGLATFVELPEAKATIALQQNAVPICLLLVTESILRLLRDNTLESLGAQRFTQMGVFLRTATVIGLALIARGRVDQFDTALVLQLELVASVVTLTYAVFAVARHLKGIAATSESLLEADRVGAEQFDLRSCMRLGLHNYGSTIISYAVSTQTLILVASMFSGAAQLAQFGLICRLFDIARGYVPALMLMSVLRPRFVAVFSVSKSFQRVAHEAAMASRFSLLTVAPIVGVLIVYGDFLISVVSGGRIDQGGTWLAALIATLLMRVHRQISVVLANCVELAGVLLRISLFGLAGWSVAWWIFKSSMPIVAALLLIFIDEFVWVVGMAVSLKLNGYKWDSGLAQVLSSLVAIVPGVGLTWWFDSLLANADLSQWARVSLGTLLLSFLFLPMARLCGLWGKSDLGAVRKMANGRAVE